MIGNATPIHRVVDLEKTQHESVAFGEEAAQYEHSPPRLLEKPQLSGSFCTACMQEPVTESAGSAQFVKSARICVSAYEEVVLQTLLAAICCSLCA